MNENALEVNNFKLTESDRDFMDGSDARTWPSFFLHISGDFNAEIEKQFLLRKKMVLDWYFSQVVSYKEHSSDKIFGESEKNN